MENVMEKKKWVLEDHLCRVCGGRVLRCVEGNGMTPGGDPIVMCADCGKSGYGRPDCICWCGMTHRNSNIHPYRCLPFEGNEDKKAMFRACGIEPNKFGVGIVLTSDLRR
jgi:hypothetical protein